MVREHRVLISVATDPDFGASYLITAYEVGAQVTSGSAGATATVRAGHGFAALDKFIVGTDPTRFGLVDSITGTTQLNLHNSMSLAQGEYLINLGQDSGTIAPSYADSRGAGFPLGIYSDMDYTTLVANNTVTADAHGYYRYFHKGIAIWELARSSVAVPFDFYLNAGQSTVVGVDSTTDNAIVRWDGTTGEFIQDSLILVNDAGQVSGTGTSGIGQLTMSGDIIVPTAQHATWDIGKTAARFRNGFFAGTMSITGVTTTGSSLGIAGALSGVTTLVTSGNVTAGGNVIRSVAAGLTASTTQTQGQQPLTKDINEVSVCANANDTVTMPAAAAGLQITIINNGAQTLRIFPASGDQFSGSAADAAVTLVAAANVRYTAINSTLWEAI